MLTAAQICALSVQTSKTGNIVNGVATGFAAQAGQLLNAIGAELCQEQDFDSAKTAFNFTFSGAVSPIGNLNVQSASGPFVLPADYLRAKKGDILYFPPTTGNFPLKLIPIDLEEFDSLIQQSGFQNYPVYWVTDMSNKSPILTTTGTTHATTTLDGLASVSGVSAGQGVSGPGIVPGTIVSSVGSSSVVLSAATTSSVTTGSFFFAVPPVAYVWPPASGAFPCLVRYYRQMPDIVTPETSSAIPWFPNQQFLITELSGRLMQLSGDDRWQAFLSDNEDNHPGGSRVLLRRYLQMKDDTANRSKRVTLDPRRFGSDWRTLPPSKFFGY